MRILVLGAGRMGLGAAYDLAHNSDGVAGVTVADLDASKAGNAQGMRDAMSRAVPLDEDVCRCIYAVATLLGPDAILVNEASVNGRAPSGEPIDYRFREDGEIGVSTDLRERAGVSPRLEAGR